MTGVIWTSQEDEMLKQLVEEHGTKKWSFIATKIKTKGSKQCRRRWKNFLNMNAKTCSWSPEEDEQLVQLHRQHGNKWTEISRVFGDRTDNAVKNRWAALLRKNPKLGEDDSRGACEPEAPAAKRQRLENLSPMTLYQPYIGHHSQLPSVMGRVNGEAVTNMPTPFDQELMLSQPPLQQQYFAPMIDHHHQQQPFDHHQQQLLVPGQQPGVTAPLSIFVNKDILNPGDLNLVQQINQTQAPVHIEVQERPVSTDATAELVAKRSSWRQFVEGLDEPKNTVNDILAWFGPSSSNVNQLQGNLGRRLTRSLSKFMASGGESLTDEHRSLLVRLMSKGLEHRTMSEQAELDLMGLATAALSEGAELVGAAPQEPALPLVVAEPAGEHSIHRPRSAQIGQGAASNPQPLPATAQPATHQPAPPPGGGLIPRRSLQRPQQQQQQQQQQAQDMLQQCSIPASLPSLGEAFGDVLLTPTFTSSEIAMLIEALAPGTGDAPK